MKTAAVILGLVVLVMSASAQEEEGEWKIMPGVTFVKYLPGERIYRNDGVPRIDPTPWPDYSSPYKYSGTGLNFTARCFNSEFKPVAFTFGAGVNWYYQPTEDVVNPPILAEAGVGKMLRGGDFNTFPLSVGVQAIYPYDSPDKLMVYGGVEGNLQLISGNINLGEQAKAGYSLVGGFAVKIFEFGVRYTSFSDITNLGVQLGMRFKTFSF